MKKHTFDVAQYGSGYYMKSGDMHVGFNMPDALRSMGEGDDEIVHGLPPYGGRANFLVDEYEPGVTALEDMMGVSWPRSKGSLTSYFVPVVEDKGMWLDFNSIDTQYEVALVVTVQGVNAITGLPCEDVFLEQYKDKCPKHDTDFGPHRFCKKCGFKWPKQNYLCSTGQPWGNLWIDGFRAADGVVRQYILSQEKVKGVANAIVGERRAWSIGISFFLSKEKRSETTANMTHIRYANSWIVYTQPNFFSPVHTPLNWQLPIGSGHVTTSGVHNVSSTTQSWGKQKKLSRGIDDVRLDSVAGPDLVCGAIGSDAWESEDGGLDSLQGIRERKAPAPNAVTHKQVYDSPSLMVSEDMTEKPIDTAEAIKKLEVGAGAKVDQKIHDDPNDLDFWREKHEAVIVINYCTEEACRMVLEKGKVDVIGSDEGFLKDIPVGNKEKQV